MGAPTQEEARTVIAAKKFRQLFIAGEYVDPRSERSFERISPVDGSPLGQVAFGDAADVDRAVGAARAAFEDGRWSRVAPRERKPALVRLGELVQQHREDLAALMTLETGKPITKAMGEASFTARNVAWFGELIDKVYGSIAPTGPGLLGTITREPVGVVAAITPWNFPLSMPLNKIVPALAAGNSVVLKPAEQSPLVALRLAELVAEAGVPDGVFNVVTGEGETGDALVRHPGIDAIGFTGSTIVGLKIMEAIGQSTLKKVALELGGKSPNVVFEDFDDLDTVAGEIAGSIFFNAGQVCDAGSRLIAHEAIAEELVAKVVDASAGWHPGHPFDESTNVGSVVDSAQLDRILGYIETGRSEGAELLTGGRRTMEETGGYYVEPTVFGNVGGDMRIAQEEIFGPVLSAITFRTEEEALALANGTSYGLAAGVWSRDLGRAHRVARRLRAGVVYVNCYDHWDPSLPFGGMRQSGFGRDSNASALDNYTELKATVFNIER